MHVVAVTGSYRSGRTIDTLVERALEGALSREGVTVQRIVLRDLKMAYCRNCMACKQDDPDKPYARCVISDDLSALLPDLERADRFIFATPVNMGQVTAVMKTFLERICWVFSKPGRRPLPGCPTPRGRREKQAILLASSGIVPPLFRRFCDDATPLLRVMCRDAFNARVVGTLYAGAVHRRGVERYLERAYTLGRRLTA